MAVAPRRVVKRAEVRQDEILDAAQRLFLEQGYEATPIQAIIDAVGIAKGTFYHHYPSKPALLDALIARLTQQSLDVIRPILEAPDLRGIDKLNGVFRRVGAWKADRRALLTEMHRALNAEANTTLRVRMQRDSIAAMTPMVAAAIAQGVAEGDFDTAFPQEAARIVLELGIILGQAVGEALLKDAVEDAEIDDMVRGLEAYHDAVTRVLGAPPGRVRLVDIDGVLVWLRPTARG